MQGQLVKSSMSETSQLQHRSEPDVTHFKVRVLLVDDQLIIVEAVRRMLDGQPDIEFHYVSRRRRRGRNRASDEADRDPAGPGDAGRRRLRADPGLPRRRRRWRTVPVIVLSAKEDPKLKAHSFAVGANDYVVKLPDRLELLARVRYHSAGHISRLQRDEAFRFLRESQQRLADANIELQKLAALDGLTGIANRRRFDEVMPVEWQRGQREKKPLSLLMCDIDCFKHHNDTFGHQAGDLCLKKAAAVLTEHLKRPADLAARYGGEEFAIVLPDTDSDGAMMIAEACRAHLEALAIENTGVAVGDW